MKLDLWNIFYEVASTGNISRASEKMHISQPAITKQIKNLENELECKLFIRTQKGVILTKKGELIYQDIKNGINALNTAYKKIKSENEIITGNIRIGSSTTLVKTYLMPFIKEFHEKYPNVIFEISTEPTSRLKELLKIGKIDIIVAKFYTGINDDFVYDKIGEMHDIFIVNDKYKELFQKEISLKVLENYPILLQKQPSSSRDFIEKFCENNNIKLKSIMEIASSNLLIEFSKIGYGIGVVTKEYVKKELKNKELYELKVKPNIPKRDFGIITLKNNYLSMCCKEFLKSFKS